MLYVLYCDYYCCCIYVIISHSLVYYVIVKFIIYYALHAESISINCSSVINYSCT